MMGDNMSIFNMETIVLGMVQTNCYIVYHGDTREAVVFDPADNAGRIEKYLKANDLVCKGILLTHGHFDHIMAVAELKAAVSSPVYAHEAEAVLLKDTRLNASIHTKRECTVVPDVFLTDEQVLHLAGFTIKVYHTPGHTAGGVCYYFPEHQVLFSGDTLFLESIGRTDLPTGNGRLLIESIRNKLLLLQDEVKVFPGHGDSTTIGYERDNNIYLNHFSGMCDQ
jgi:glyoxylase-like metal-dependent hydrolase (beta-lactamase superfamily II)